MKTIAALLCAVGIVVLPYGRFVSPDGVSGALASSAFASEISALLALPFGAECHECEECGGDPVRHETEMDTPPTGRCSPRRIWRNTAAADPTPFTGANRHTPRPATNLNFRERGRSPFMIS